MRATIHKLDQCIDSKFSLLVFSYIAFNKGIAIQCYYSTSDIVQMYFIGFLGKLKAWRCVNLDITFWLCTV